MTVRVYRSTDASAPVLTGLQGSFISLLDACLVNGYGSQTSSGWTKPYSTTNKAAFKQPATANERYLVVDETTADIYSRCTGYESMTSISATFAPFPATNQGNTGNVVFPRSNSFTSAARPWTLIATDKMFHIWGSVTGNTPVDTGGFLSFGDINSYMPTDVFNTIIIGSSTAVTNQPKLPEFSSNLSLVTTGHFMARGYTQIGASIAVSKISDYGRSLGMSASGQSSLGMPFPNPVDGRIYVSPFYLGENGTASGCLRGILPGVWCILHANSNFAHGDVLTNVAGATSGAVFEVQKHGASSCVLFEISNTW